MNDLLAPCFQRVEKALWERRWGLRRVGRALCALSLLTVVGACSSRDQPGSAARPLRLVLYPAADREALAEPRAALARGLASTSGLVVQTRVPIDYLDAVQQLGDGDADVAFLNDLAFLLAAQTYGAEARLKVLRQGGRHDHRGQILVRPDAVEAGLAGLAGKRLAYVDPYSATGFVLAAEQLAAAGVQPGVTSFVGSHAEAVRQVIAGDADAAATYVDEASGPGLPPELAQALRDRHPDAASRVAALQTSAPVANEPVVFRRDLAPAITTRVIDGLIQLASDPASVGALQALGGVTGFAAARSSDYDELRRRLQTIGKDVEEAVPGGWRLKLHSAEPLRAN